MGSKRKGYKGLSKPKAGSYKLRDLAQDAAITIDMWTMPDPTKSYDANVCDVVMEGGEMILSFGQTAPGFSRPVTAISISVPTNDIRSQMDSFAEIKKRLVGQNFNEQETLSRHLDLSQLEEMTAQNYWRDSAQIIRSICSDDLAVLDFYRRPLLTQAVINARPNEDFEMLPVLRLTCSAQVLHLMLKLVDKLMMKETADA